MRRTRREFLKQSAAVGMAAGLPFAGNTTRSRAANRNSELTVAAIGVGGSRGAYSQGRAIAHRAAQHARMIAVCDVDALHMSEFNEKFDKKLKEYADYRQLLEREKPDIVTIGTPDHWHVPIAVAALRAGCDVYCEKPLTLTIEEGFIIRDAVKQTGRVFQVGTQQRSENDLVFLQAIAIVKSGRLGSKVNAYAAIGGAPVEGPFPETDPPDQLDWDMWVGPAQPAGYSQERCKEFRWFYDYSGGKLTDWGAHHIDIAQWALGHDHSGPQKINGTGDFPPMVPERFDWHAYLDGRASLPNGYHTPSRFGIDCEFADGAVLHVCDSYDRGDGKTQFGNGILFEGEEGRIFVNRERLTGRPVEEMTDAEWQKINELVIELYKGQQPGDHMRNFFEAVHSRGTPIGDVGTHHRTMTTCHLCNIALMLGRELKWDPQNERFDGDEQATMLMSRPRREKFSWDATTS
jgi:myo-inositol 2-dehydrogenase / D-chiro-inositol 1-dehydrogenase